MATDPITTRFEKLFAATDTNHDGTLEWADYQRMIERITKAWNLPANDRRALALKTNYQMLWLELTRHAGSERLSKEQFVSALRMVVVDTSRMNMTEGLPHALFDIADANEDAELGKDEFIRLVKAASNAAEPEALEAFTRLDTDGDGAISRHEFTRSFREFLHSADPNATTGGLVLGVL